jgi:chemotaxis protein MotB
VEHHGGHTIVVKKRRHAHGGHHGGAWKVAYADFVTAMMAFFLVMWLVGQTDAVKASVAGYFQDPVGFSDKFADMGKDLDAKASAGPSAVAGLLSAPPKTEARREMEEVARSLRQYLGELGAFAKLKHAIEIEVTDEGLEISLIESEEDFFALGGKALSPSGEAVLRALGHEIAEGGFEVVVEGHTDSVPYGGKDPDYSNWELSADRANAARRVLEASGVAPGKVRSVRGYASSKPRPFHWPEDPRNRRIAILVARHFED